jgi:ribosome maturation factor RimP
MVPETHNQAIEQMVNRLLEDNPEYFLVELRINPTNNIKVFLDSDTGISIDQCVKYNRLLYKQLEETGWFPDGNFSLEVSSPGLDEPLKLLRQYQKNTGRKVELILKNGETHVGKLLSVSADGVLLEETKGKNKKKELIQHQFTFDNIKTTKIQAEI